MNTSIENRLRKIEERLDQLSRPGVDRLITPKELAEKFGCSQKTIYKLVKEYRIPYLKLFSDMRFSEKEINKLIQSKIVKALGG